MSEESGDPSRHRDNFFGVLEMTTVLLVSMLWEYGIVSFESAVIALLTMVVLVLMFNG